MELIAPVMILALTGLGCGAILAAGARFFAVKEDPRIEQLTALLPGANCGACGFPGCGEYAKEILFHGAAINLCNRGGNDVACKVSGFLGVNATTHEPKVALVLCQGDDTKAVRFAQYNGIADCVAAELAGGNKQCRFGCLGLGSCARVCPVGAIEITQHNLAVVHPETCISCGLCTKKCPRHIIRLVPRTSSVHILCRSKDKGPATKKACSVGCIGCSICFKTVEGKGIVMDGPLAMVDYTAAPTNEEIITRCPQKTIVKRTGTDSENKAGVA